MKKIYASTKTYTHNEGLSCCFRQWRADSHCRYIHGYALGVEIAFVADTLDNNGWVMDFGGLKDIKQWLHDMFDHRTLVAADDPELPRFKEMDDARLLQLVVVERTGCEAFAALVYDAVRKRIPQRVALAWVRVAEHPGNSAIVYNSDFLGL